MPVIVSAPSPTLPAARCRARRVEAFWNSRRGTRGRCASGSTARSAPARCGRTSRSCRRLADVRSSLLPQRRPAQRVRRLRRDARADGEARSATSPRRAWSTSSAAAAARRPSTSRRSPPPSRASPPRASRATRATAALRPRAARRITPGQRLRHRRRAHQRHRLARVRATLIKDDNYDEALSRSRASRSRAAPTSSTSTWTRACSTASPRCRVPQPDRRRARHRARPGHGRLLEVVGDRGRAQVPAGQGRRQLDLAQGGRGRVPAPGHARAAVRRGGGRDGVRRDGPGRLGRAHGSRSATRAYRILTEQVGFPAEDIIFDPNILADRHRHRGARPLRGRLHRGDAADQGDAARTPRSRAACRNVSFSFRGNDPVREAMHAVFLYHAIRAGLDMGSSTPASSRLREIDPELREHVEDVRAEPPARRHRAPARVRDAVDGESRRSRRGRGPGVARRAARRAARPRAGQGHRPTSSSPTPTRRGIAADAAARRHRGPADGRHERRRRPVRRRQDVPAAGRQVRARDEEGGRATSIPFMEAEKAKAGATRKASGKIVIATVKGDVHDIGKNIVGVVLRCNDYEVIDLGVMVPAAKILDTASEDERRPHRPVRPDHAVARRDGPRRARDGAPRHARCRC